MNSSNALRPGDIKKIDHATFGYPRGTSARSAIDFFATLGLKPSPRDEPRTLDEFLPGTRYDFRVGDGVITFAPASRRRMLWIIMARQVFGARFHVAFEVTSNAFDALVEHPHIDLHLGAEGLVRWGTGDWSVFLSGPYGLQFEFRCPTAHHIDP